MDMWRFLFGSVVARPAIVSICGGPQDGQNFDVWWYLDSMCGSIRQMYPICGGNQYMYVVPTKTVQMTWICSTLLFRCIWICGVVSICGDQPGVLDMDI